MIKKLSNLRNGSTIGELKNPEGKLSEPAGVLKKGEKKSRDRNLNLDIILNVIPELIYTCDREGNILEFLNPVRSSKDIDKQDQLAGRRIQDVLDEESATLLLEKIGVCLASKEIVGIEYVYIEGDRTDYYEVKVASAGDDLVLLFIRDITEKKMILDEIRKLTLAIEQSPVSIVMTDTEANIRYTSPAFEKMTGYTFKEVEGKNISILKSGQTSKAIYSNLWDTITAGKTWEGEWINKKKNGKFYWESVVISSLRNDVGEITGYLAVKEDVNKRKETEQRLQDINQHLESKVEARTAELAKVNKEVIAAREEAERANRAKSVFLTNMSHEIRTPMNAVLGYAEILGRTITDKVQKEYVESIRSSGKGLLNLINDVLDLSKIEAGKMDLEYSFVEVPSFFSEFEKIFALKLEQKGVLFEMNIASGMVVGIFIDETRLRQVILNLIGNAVKFTHIGYIRINVSMENPRMMSDESGKTDEYIDLVITIEDTGIGVSKENQKLIFEEFMQSGGKKSEGTGLGLAITKRLIDIMGGFITLESALHEGSKFTVTLPDVKFVRELRKEESDKTFYPDDIQFAESMLLVIDDTEVSRRYIRDALKGSDLKVIEAADGNDGLAMAEKFNPGLIICDIRMPDMDGYEFLERISKMDHLKEIPVLAYSAYVMKEEKSLLFESEFDGILIKPVMVSELYAELIKHLPHVVRKRKANPVPEEELKGENILHPGELVRIMEIEYYPKWKRFKKRQPLKEIREFGAGLNNLGMKHNVNKLIQYGDDICATVDSFNIDKMLVLLHQFPELLRMLKSMLNK